MQKNEAKTIYMNNTFSNISESVSYSLTVFDGIEDFYEIDLQSFHKPVITFGRSSDNDIVLKSALVSRQHGCFDISDGKIRMVDMNSTNGVYMNGVRLAEAEFCQGDIMRIDSSSHAKPDGVLMIVSDVHGANNWNVMQLESGLTIGRNAGNDIVLPHVAVSAQHAELTRLGDKVILKDLNSTNGVFVNGVRVSSAELHEKDIVSILNTKLIWSAGKLYYYTYRAGFRIDAQHIVKKVRNKHKKICICDDVSLSIEPGSLVAIIGGSGAGKSTFMNAISGYGRPTSGNVLVNGEELYQHYDALKNIIGYVPQQDIVYDDLTLGEMLNYAAKLRLPDDTTRAERAVRVKDVIEMVELTGKESTLIRKLSGGQRKRASIAVELLPDPSLFFLDEPASGLDPGTERNLMKTLHKMALTGKTVVLVTHSTLNLQECDKIIFMGSGGKLSYYGSAEAAMGFFGVEDLVDTYNLIMQAPDEWCEKYKKHLQPNSTADVAVPDGKLVSKNKHKRGRQIATLSKRYLKLIWHDKQRLLLLLLQAPLLAFLISLVKDGDEYYSADSTKALLFALACSAFWLGTLNAIQEICKERTILRREYMTGVHLGPYILSKYIALGIISALQAAMLVGVFITLVGTPLSSVMFAPEVEIFITCFLTILSSVATGLFVSSLFTNTDRAMTIVPLLLIPQILFSGILFTLEGVTEKISYFIVSRWAMEGFGTTVDINSMKVLMRIGGVTQEYDVKASDFFTVSQGHLLKVWGIMLAFTIGFGLLSFLVLRRLKRNT